MPRVIWLPDALKDARRLRMFLEDKSPIAAKRAAKTLQNGENMLAKYPEAGSPLNDGTGRRELIQPFGTGAYVLRYVVDNQTVFIVRAWHSKENRNKIS